ncbi:hypothetical protein DNU06_15445 [Putridiphycobacter roseus]|uniref:Uncharacterized protein n=1 Tax=Putridiphycobacter roseus TaxID=2219161 RepID=A0A2W1MZ93_9FLAO|nr:hypothetical protein [Putridiphycobacter roseus]PZE15901.1 hypothetical protein DNU06_15445 [Putridiphycobacter roseus]
MNLSVKYRAIKEIKFKSPIILPLVILAMLQLSACKKKVGCTDASAVNYNEFIDSQNEDNSCFYISECYVEVYESFVNKMLDEGAVKIELLHEDSIYPIYDSAETYNIQNYADLFTFFVLSSEGNKKHDTTTYELVSYITQGDVLTLPGKIDWIGGLISKVIID